MTTPNNERTPEFITPIERAWLDLLRIALTASTTGAVTFEQVNVRDGKVWATRALETIHCGVPHRR
jgi:hypothetical protein